MRFLYLIKNVLSKLLEICVLHRNQSLFLYDQQEMIDSVED